MTETSKILCFILIVSFSIFKVQAQQLININGEDIYHARQMSDDPATGSIFTGAEKVRLFSYNTRLASLTQQNKGDTLLLDFFEDKKFKAIIKRINLSKDGILSITAQLADADFGYCYISISDEGISISADIPRFDEQFRVSGINGKTYLSHYKMNNVQKEILEGSNPIIPPDNPSIEKRRESNEAVMQDDCSDDINDNATIDRSEEHV